MNLVTKLVITVFLPAAAVVLGGWYVQETRGREVALRAAQRSLDNCAQLTADLVHRSLEAPQADLAVLATQSSFAEYAMFSRLGLHDDAEQQRLRIEEAAVQLIEHRDAYDIFDFHDVKGQGVVRVENSEAVLRYTPAAKLPWFVEAMAKGRSVVVVDENSLRITTRVRLDGVTAGVVSCVCNAKKLLGSVLDYASQTAPARSVRFEHPPTKLALMSAGPVGVEEKTILAQYPIDTITDAAIVVEQPVSVAIAQYNASERSFATALLTLSAGVLMLTLVSIKLNVLKPLKTIHAKAVAFEHGEKLSSAMLEQRDEFGDLDRALTASASQLMKTMASIRSLNDGLEQKVEERTAALTESESRFRAIVEGTSSTTGAAFFDALVQSISVASGTRSAMICTISDDDKARVLAFWDGQIILRDKIFDLAQTPSATVYRKGYFSADDLSQERFLQNATLTDWPVRGFVGVRLSSADGTPLGILCALHDGPLPDAAKDKSLLSVFGSRAGTELERTKAEQELQTYMAAIKDTNESLERANIAAQAATRAKSEFLANMSHEIRTPMNGIIGMTELALNTKLNSEQEQYLSTVMECADSLLTIINDILDFSKIEAGKLDLEYVDFDLVSCIEGTLDVLAPRVSAKDVELIADIDPAVPRFVKGDPTRLRQVLLNIVGNAAKFTERGEILVLVEPVSDADRDNTDKHQLRFSIVDTGIGIAADRVDAVFDSFTQADGATTRRFGGTGLGLAISKKIVELSGGRIWAESVLGKGSAFKFELPLPIGKQVEADTTHSVEDVVGRRILVIDDNATNLSMLKTLLNSWGCEVTTASDGMDGLKLLQTANTATNPYEVVVLDVQMPDMDGLEVARRIDTGKQYGQPTVILASSIGDRSSILSDDPVPFDAYLTKPMRRATLRETLSKVLGQHEPITVEELSLTSPQPDLTTKLHGRVLLVEDNLVNQRVAKRLLEKIGCEVTVADNGRLAVDAAKQNSFELIFMDVQMPDMDGFEATMHIRKMQKSGPARTPIIAMTAHAMVGDRERCLDSGMDDYLTKPIKLDMLQAMLNKWLNQQRPEPAFHA